MTADDADEALEWAGDEKPVAAPGSVAPPESATALPAPFLISYGVMAGLYLIATLGWIITVTRSGTPQPDPLASIMGQLGELLAAGSPALWFAAVFLLARRRSHIVRLGWLVIGLVMVAPWPFVVGV